MSEQSIAKDNKKNFLIEGKEAKKLAIALLRHSNVKQQLAYITITQLYHIEHIEHYTQHYNHIARLQLL